MARKLRSRTAPMARVGPDRLDAATWTSFDSVLSVYVGGGYDGIGFVLGDPFLGIDLDHCRDLQTGIIEPWAQTIINNLNSYTEITPSNTGIHILIKAKLHQIITARVTSRFMIKIVILPLPEITWKERQIL